jgi:pimeloyl-ACP methyl ester carboxylesterase
MGDFETVRLSHGPLEFSGLALGEGPLVLLLHGFPDNPRSWRHQLPALAGAGYRAVAMHIRGYEPGSQPADGDYSLATLATDIVAFLDGLEAETAHLVGHDWGAGIAYTTAAQMPDRLRSLTTVAVPHAGRFLSDTAKHPRQLRLSWYMLFFQLRGVADHVVARRDFEFLRMLWRQWSPEWDIPGDELEEVIETFRQPGVPRAALAYYRAALALSALPLTPRARRKAKYPIAVPTLAITGASDRCIDTDVFHQLMHREDFPQGLEVQQIAGAGHFPQQEQPERVNRLLLNWLEKHNV